MIINRVEDQDSLFRSIVYPLAHRNNRAFRSEKFIHLKEEGGTINASLVWQQYAPTDAEVHAYGCRLANGMNEQLLANGKTTMRDRRCYCGAYHLHAESIRSLSTISDIQDIEDADVVHLIENGEIAHVDMKISLKADTDPDSIEGTKTQIAVWLWNRSSGPLRHVCQCDEDMSDHPSNGMPIAPMGEYKV